MGSIQAHALEHWEEAGQLNSVPIDESKIPAEDRIPRMTSAIWYSTNILHRMASTLRVLGGVGNTRMVALVP